VTSDGSTLSVPPEQIYALAAQLRDQTGLAEEAAAWLVVGDPIAGPLQPALEHFLHCHRAGAQALAGELHWLGATIAAVVDSWLDLDGTLLGPHGSSRPA
jgi:hypothetical protein